MVTVAIILSITSGFFMARFHETPANLIGTSLAIDAALAPLTAVIASRKGRYWPFWMVVGFGFGVWALTWILLFGNRRLAHKNGASPPAEAA